MKYTNKNLLEKKHPLKRPKCPHFPCFPTEKWCVESSLHRYNGSRFVHLDHPSSQWHLAILGCLWADDARCCVPPGRHGGGNDHEDKESGSRPASCWSLECNEGQQSHCGWLIKSPCRILWKWVHFFKLPWATPKERLSCILPQGTTSIQRCGQLNHIDQQYVGKKNAYFMLLGSFGATFAWKTTVWKA